MIVFVMYKSLWKQHPSLFPVLKCTANVAHFATIYVFYLFIIYLMILSVTWTILCQMFKWFMNNELKRMWSSQGLILVLSYLLPAEKEENHKKSVQRVSPAWRATGTSWIWVMHWATSLSELHSLWTLPYRVNVITLMSK